MVTLFRSVAMEYKCRSALSYNEGKSYAVDYAIVPHGADADDLLWENALAFNTPLVETDTVKADWRIHGAYLSAMRTVGDDVFLRLYTGTAAAKTVKIVPPAEYRRYAYTDGLMNPGDWQKIDGEITVELAPYEVKGIRFAR